MENRGLQFDEPEGSSFQRGRNHLLVIGIDTYAHLPPLRNARRDAEQFVALLHDRYRFEPAQTTTVYDVEASRDALIRSLRDQVNRLEKNDNLLVYFSGHGHYDDVLEEAYWCPADARPGEIGSYLSYDFLMRIARACKKARHVFFIVDSCYSGAVFVRSGPTQTHPAETDPSRWLLASGRNEVVSDGTAENSPFAEELLELLRKPGGEGINALSLINTLTNHVGWNSGQTPIGQPLHGVGHKGGQFIFHPKRNEARDWREAQAADNASAYDRFLRAWPEGQHADEARWRRACTYDTKAAYRRYLNAGDGGAFVRGAIDRIRELEDRDRFERARRQGEGALLQFCLDYPDSAYCAEAKAEIQRIRRREAEPQAWREATQTNTVAAYRGYLDAFSGGPNAAEARKRIEQFEAKTRRKREAEQKRRRQQTAQEMGMKKPPLVPPKTPTPPFWKRRPVQIAGGLLLLLFLGWGGLRVVDGLFETTEHPPQQAEISADGEQTTDEITSTLDSPNVAASIIPPQLPSAEEESTGDSAPIEDTPPPRDPLQSLRDQGFSIGNFMQRVAIYQKGQGRRAEMGLVHADGRRLGDTYYKVEELGDGYAVFHQNGKRGYLNLRGEVAIPAQYDAAWGFGEDYRGLAKVRSQGRLIYIDEQGACQRNCPGAVSQPRATERPNTQPATRPGELIIPEMKHIPGGTFTMGSNDGHDDEKPPHQVTVSSFDLGKYEVTFEEYDAFCDATGREKPNDSGWGRGRRPVINVSWNDATAYAAWLSRQTGQRWRLPTEAEWEYAAGGGSKGRTKWAGTNEEAALGDYAWYSSNSGRQTHPVGGKRPNALGLYDMSGNVWEWCQDWYGGDYYASSPSSNPQGPASGSIRVDRGGSWGLAPRLCRVALRGYGTPALRSDALGFRLARSL